MCGSTVRRAVGSRPAGKTARKTSAPGFRSAARRTPRPSATIRCHPARFPSAAWSGGTPSRRRSRRRARRPGKQCGRPTLSRPPSAAPAPGSRGAALRRRQRRSTARRFADGPCPGARPRSAGHRAGRPEEASLTGFSENTGVSEAAVFPKSAPPPRFRPRAFATAEHRRAEAGTTGPVRADPSRSGR